MKTIETFVFQQVLKDNFDLFYSFWVGIIEIRR